jgi:hypothetical protein
MQCHAVRPGFAVVFYNQRNRLEGMSLNRSEQLLHDYMQSHPDERQYWVSKVQTIVRDSIEASQAVSRLDAELWRYYLERSEVAPVFMAAAKALGLKRTSMKNLAEYLVRLWTEPRPRKVSAPIPPDAGD